MKRLLFLLLLMPSMAWAEVPRLGWYTSGTFDGLTWPLDTNSTSDTLLLRDTIYGGGYKVIMGCGPRAAKWLDDRFGEDVITAFYITAMDIADRVGNTTGEYGVLADAQIYPWNAHVIMARGDTVCLSFPAVTQGLTGDTANPRFDGFSRVTNIYQNGQKPGMRTPGLREKAGSWSDFTDAGWKGTASVTDTTGDTIYFGDFMPNDSLRLDLSTALASGDTAKLQVEYYDTASGGQWAAVSAKMESAIRNAFLGTTDTTVWFDIPPPLNGANMWGYSTVTTDTIALLWCRMYFDATLTANAPVITRMRRASYHEWIDKANSVPDSVGMYGWNPALDTSGNGWRDSIPSSTDTANGRLATCRHYAHLYNGAEFGRRFAGITNALYDTTAMKTLAGIYFSGSTVQHGICFDQSPFLNVNSILAHSLGAAAVGRLLEYGTDDQPTWTYDSVNFHWKRDVMYNYLAHIKDTVGAYSDTPYTGATTSEWRGTTNITCGSESFTIEYMSGINWNHCLQIQGDSTEWFDALDMFFTEYGGGAGEGTFWASNANTMMREYYKFICSNQRVLIMWNIGYWPSDTTRGICNDVHRDVFWNYSIAHYWLIRPGGTMDDNLYYGRYASVDGQTVECQGRSRGDSYQHDWLPHLILDLGEPIDTMDNAATYATRAADSLWSDFEVEAASHTYKRLFVKGADTNMTLWRYSTGPGNDNLTDVNWDAGDSATITLDTFNLGGWFYRVYPDGDTASPLHPGVATQDTLVALMPNDGALLLAANAPTGGTDTAFQYRGLNLRGVNIGLLEIDHGTEETTEGCGRTALVHGGPVGVGRTYDWLAE